MPALPTRLPLATPLPFAFRRLRIVLTPADRFGLPEYDQQAAERWRVRVRLRGGRICLAD
jgi:hypothetical protein